MEKTLFFIQPTSYMKNRLTVRLKMSVVVKQQQHISEVDLIPNGTYPATLTDIKQFDNAYGQRLGFEFTLQGGQLDGQKVMRSTSPNLSAQSKLTDLLQGLLGRTLEDQELMRGLDARSLVGTDCNVLVLQARVKSGKTYSNVERVFK
jgi:hypothetical protein